ncbi:catalase [Oceanobacillus jeddahense]|uniref:Catalase n=1 Tax=Oceanobacillus jeddahense TaxID=1462527 RepID=A0ABY5JVR3_9BACI|nr:catalase [Oceanobacillus jeddahense]UUI04171.1 catalase [Oceanobacillus jeddahense]
MSEKRKMTTAFGAPVPNDDDSKTAGKRGPLLMEDFWFLEKLAHFDREVIPERRMHAKGSGAYGTLTITNDITKYTKAKIFSEVGKKTDMFIRFSTVAGERGAADAERDIRGTAMKFYTEEGNWDLVGNNTPVFFMRDPKRFPDLNHVVKRDPKTNMKNADANWDFWSNLPEALHQVTVVMSDRGIPKSYRNMHLFGSHAYSLYNENNERVWVKFHFRTQQGIENLTNQEAANVVGADRESHQRDLYTAIEEGNFPKWKMYIQVMTEEEAKNMPYNPFDLTKVWYKDEFPLIEVGELELNKNPENYHEEVEQAAFAPTNIVPGIGFSPDKMLQGRLFSYGDAQRYRLGVNHWQIPVNYPKNAKNFHPYHRDGAMRVVPYTGGQVSYSPNQYGEWEDSKEHQEPALQLGADVDADYFDFDEDDALYYEQPGKLFRLMSDEQKQALFRNTADDIAPASKSVKLRHINNCYKADPEYGKGVAEAIGISLDEVEAANEESVK